MLGFQWQEVFGKDYEEESHQSLSLSAFNL